MDWPNYNKLGTCRAQCQDASDKVLSNSDNWIQRFYDLDSEKMTHSNIIGIKFWDYITNISAN